MGLVKLCRSLCVSAFLVIVAVLCPLAPGRTFYVDDSATGDGDGSSWSDSYTRIQAGINAAADGDTVLVRPGTYVENINFNGKDIVVGSLMLTTGDTSYIYRTIIDGGQPQDPYEGSVVYFISGEDSTAVLNGFTITGGSGTVWPTEGLPPSLWQAHGGGILLDNNSCPSLIHLVVAGNVANAANGAGICCLGNSDCLVENVIVTGNDGLPVNSKGNDTNDGTGGVYLAESSPSLRNVLIAGNTGLLAGGLFCNEDSNPILINVTIAGNIAFPSGYYNEAAELISWQDSNPTLINTIIWNDSLPEIVVRDNAITISYSDVQSGSPGIITHDDATVNWLDGNIASEPLFVDPLNMDYRLQVGSPCMDSGDNSAVRRSRSGATDLDGNPRIVNGIVDMGAYEGGVVPTRSIRYVDADAQGSDTGSSWVDAHRCLQDALAVAQYGDEIWVAGGVYRPDQHVVLMRGGLRVVGSGDRTAAFQLINGVAIKGGYAGFGEPDPNARDTELYTTVLSGDLSGDDEPDFASNSENSRNVVTGSDTNETAVLDGVTISAANNDGAPQRGEGWIAGGWGGGMYNDGGSPTIMNCIFWANSARYGGGMLNDMGSCPTLTDCTFSENVATYHGGGGMYNRANSTPLLANCIFTANSARWGGAMYNGDGNCLQMINCTFAGNIAEEGGGIHNNKGSNVVVVNCTFAANEAGAIVCAGARPTVVNSILWGNGSDEINLLNASIDVTYCDVEGGWPGVGNVDADPLFADPDNGDYHLRSQAGRWNPVSESWVTDDVTSPCIDAGSPSRFTGNEPEPNGSRINMGAYGGTTEASMSSRFAGR